MCAGFAVPLLGLAIGWRGAFVSWGALAAPVIMLALLPKYGERGWQPLYRGSVGRLLAFVILSIGTFCASAAMTGMVPFLTGFSVKEGFSVGYAAVVFALASGLAGLVRVIAGILLDRQPWNALFATAMLLVIGAIGLVVLAMQWGSTGLLAGESIAFIGIWGWPGVLWLGTARASSNNPSVPMAVVQVGSFLGSSIGPVAAGSVAQEASYSGVWLILAGAAALGGVVVLFAKSMISSRPTPTALQVVESDR